MIKHQYFSQINKLQDIDFECIDIDSVHENENLFFILCAASYVESGSHVYANNLISFFEGNSILQEWLSEYWKSEELEHGRVLAKYINHVWPEFDWNAGFTAFWDEYSLICTEELLASSHGLELAARCIVETGTASLYQTLNNLINESVLKNITRLIKSDEIRHYKHFYKHYCIYRESEELGRYEILKIIFQRAKEIASEDSEIAIRHVYNQRYPQNVNDSKQIKRIQANTRKLLRQNVPISMMIKMFLRPLGLSPFFQKSIERPLIQITKKILIN